MIDKSSRAAARGGPASALHRAGTPPAEESAPPGNYKWIVLLVVGAGVYMATLDSGIVNVALPVLTREFSASLVLAQWVILGYVLCIAGLLLPAGRLADMAGRREVFIGGFALFGAASALCGLAPSIGWLIAARVLQGVGSALIQANTAALLTQAFPATERGRALGLNGSIVSLGLLSGPVIGGLITEHFGWRSAFYVNVPISAVAAPVGWYLLRPSPVAKGQRFDAAGAALFVFAAVGLLLGLNQGATWGWTSLPTLAALVTFGGAGAAFVWVERHVPHPTIDLTLFRNRGFTAAAASAFLSFLALAPVMLLMPFYFIFVLRLPVDQTGLLLTAIPAAMAVTAPFSGALSDKFGSRLIASAGLVVEVVGLGSLVFLGAHDSALSAAARLLVIGFGVGLFQSPNSSALFGSVPRSRLGVVGGFQALTRNLGQSLGQVVASLTWSAVVLAAAAGTTTLAIEAPPEVMLPGFQVVFATSAALAVVALATSLFGRPRDAAHRAAAR
ncbi:MAG: MFS transporter [Chloroflexi bacterium]|nr:MFS transporter [Chloroflexota bacterium]